MKKVLVILLACLTSTVMFGQRAVATHWRENKTGVLNTRLQVRATLAIDGEEIYNGPDGQTSGGGQIEVGVFDQDGECRCAKLPTFRTTNGQNQWIYGLQIWGNPGFTYTLRLYDHASETELEYVDALEEPIAYDWINEYPNGVVGSNSNPFILYFVTPTTEGITLEIETYTEEKDNYYLIASPVGEVDASLVDYMTEYNYDLYTFDQNPDDGKEWINHRGEEAYMLQPCVGYLYANDGGEELDTIILSFPGSAFATADTTITLAYDSEAEFAGWNLVGNPYNATAYIGATRSFYRMNEDRTDLIADPVNGGINPMEGVFVVATSAEDQITFTIEAPDVVPSLALNLSRNSKVIDRAVVNFNGERTLPKFQLNPNHTKVYIPQDNVDYAVVSAGEMGEMPVSFKAEKNGSYNMTFTAQEVNFAYLHLIDNKTGKDVDLLETPSYSFDAQTSDYTSRFKLVFATGNSTEDNFAFCSNGNWIISNDGEATLQVVDVNGRIMSEETISGCVSKSISAAPGVYMLRLINGDNVKVQKIIVK